MSKFSASKDDGIVHPSTICMTVKASGRGRKYSGGKMDEVVLLLSPLYQSHFIWRSCNVDLGLFGLQCRCIDFIFLLDLNRMADTQTSKEQFFLTLERRVTKRRNGVKLGDIPFLQSNMASKQGSAPTVQPSHLFSSSQTWGRWDNLDHILTP